MKKTISKFNEWYQIEPRLAEYEAFAWKIIKEAGYPTEWETFCEAFDRTANPPDKVKIANSIFYGIESVKNKIAKNNPDQAALEMMRLCNNGFLLGFYLIEPVLKIGQKRITQQKKNRAKKRTHKGLTKEGLKARDQQIFDDYQKAKSKNSNLTRNGFAERNEKKYRKKYDLKPGSVRKIISKKLSE